MGKYTDRRRIENPRLARWKAFYGPERHPLVCSIDSKEDFEKLERSLRLGYRLKAPPKVKLDIRFITHGNPDSSPPPEPQSLSRAKSKSASKAQTDTIRRTNLRPELDLEDDDDSDISAPLQRTGVLRESATKRQVRRKEQEQEDDQATL